MTTTDHIADQLTRLGLTDAAQDFPAASQPNPPSHGHGQAQTILPPCYHRLKRHSENGPVILVGPAGTAKTYAVHLLAKESGAELFVQQAHRSLTIEEIRGTRGLNQQGTYFEPGTLTRSLRTENAWYFLDEVNMCDPGVMSLCNNLLDGTSQITLPETGEVLHVPPNWRFFAACNRGYVGTQSLNEALKSRCAIIECDYYPPDDEAALIQRRYPDFPKTDARTIVKVAHAVRAARANGEHTFDFCLRTAWQMALEWMECGDSLLAFDEIVLPKIGDRYLFADVREALREAVMLILSETV